MASTIQIKNSNTVGNSPGSLTQGELAINVADGNLFYGDGTSVLQQFAIAQLTASGDISSSGTITGNSIVGTLSTAAQPNVTSLGTLTSLTVDNLSLNQANISSTADSEVQIILNGGGIYLDANTGDTIHINSNQNNADFQVFGENDENVIYGDASTDKVGIGTNTPGEKLEVVGNISASGDLYGDALNVGGTQFVDLHSTGFRIGSNTEDATIFGSSLLITPAITASHISASGTIEAGTISGSGGFYLKGGPMLIDSSVSQIDIYGDGIDFVGEGSLNGVVSLESSTVRVGDGSATTPSISFTSDTNTGIYHAAAADNMILQAGGGTGELIINTSGVSVNNGDLQYNSLKLSKTTNTDGDFDGAEVIYVGSTTGMDTGKLYYYNPDGRWTITDADTSVSSSGLIGVALGASSNNDGVLLKGMVTLDHDPGSVGDVLFLQTGSSGKATSDAPNGSGDIVRIIGYCLDNSNGQIYFNPSPDFIEVS